MFVRISGKIVTAISMLLMVGCAKTFVVTGEFPKPLIQGTPIAAKMMYSDEFKTYKYIEKGEDRSLESVDFGSAQVALFNRIFGSLFSLVKDDQQTADINIEPQVLDFQYSSPRETKLTLYEVWLKYRLKITDNQGQEVADWVVKGYGKTPTSMLSSQLKAFNIAANIALRDVGAQLAIGFRSQPSIESFLSKKANLKLATETDPAPVKDGGQNSIQNPEYAPNQSAEGTP